MKILSKQVYKTLVHITYILHDPRTVNMIVSFFKKFKHEKNKQVDAFKTDSK